MSREYRYDEYEEEYGNYEPGGFVANHRNRPKQKVKRKGHQSRKKESAMLSEFLNAEIPAYSESSIYYEKIDKEKKRPVNQVAIQPALPNAQVKTKPTSQEANLASLNLDASKYTHNIKGVDINYLEVTSLTTIGKESNGSMTYGIKYVFRVKQERGYYRIIWFNTNKDLRDRVYEKEQKFFTYVNSLIN